MSCIPVKPSVKSRERKKVFTSSDVLHSSENIGEEQKEKKRSLDVLYFSENVGEKQKNISTSTVPFKTLANVNLPK